VMKDAIEHRGDQHAVAGESAVPTDMRPDLAREP
jgi:hypothetical protein